MDRIQANLPLQIGDLDASPSIIFSPGFIDGKHVCSVAYHGVLPENIGDCSTPSISFQITAGSLISVYVAIMYLRNSCIETETSNRHATTNIAVDTFNQDIRGWRLDGHTFVAISNFDIVEPHIIRPNVHPVCHANGDTANDDIENLSIPTSLEYDIKGGSVNHRNSMEREVIDVCESEEAGAVFAL